MQCRERRATGQSFHAVTVPWAGAGPDVARQPSDAQVARFGMAQPSDRLSIDDDADTDARPDRDVDMAGQTLRPAPPGLRQSGTCHVGVQREGAVTN